MTLAEFHSIWRQIVIDFKYKPPYTVNTFAVNDRMPELMHNSFGHTYSEYKQNQFWSRTWVNQKADPEKIKGHFPALFVTRPSISLEDATNRAPGAFMANYAIVVIDKIMCEGCGNKKRTRAQAQKDIEQVALALIHEFMNYWYFAFNPSIDGNSHGWMSEGRQAFIGGNHARMHPIWSEIPEHSFDITPWGNFDDMVGAMFRIGINICETAIEVEFDYNNPIVEELASTTCKEC